MKTLSIYLQALLLIMTLAVAVEAQTDDPQPQSFGTVSGRVVEAETQAPIAGASVQILGTQLGAASGSDGGFAVKNVPIGSHSVRVNSVGHETVVKTDIIVRPRRITSVEITLTTRTVEVAGQDVRPSYFNKDDRRPTSSTGFSGEEIRRAPGSAGDVNRIIANLPSIAKTDDQVNALAVRGGSPLENGFYLDNIEIPNINHFPRQGTTNGSLGLVNVDLIKDVKFSAGGFSAVYGDRLSSVMELSFREGNRREFDGQLNFDMIGFGAVAEGPINKGRGSWLVSARKSFLDLLVDVANIELAPEINDYQGKIVYDLSPRSRLSLIGLYGVSIMDYTRDQAISDGNSNYAVTDNYNYTIGLNWWYLWHKDGYSNTSISMQGVKYGSDAFETKSDRVLVVNKSVERQLNLRNVNYYRAGQAVQFEFGVEGKYIFDAFDYFYGEYTSLVGDTVAAVTVKDDFKASKFGAFANFILHPAGRLTTTFGLRFDYFDHNERSHFSPRFSAAYELTSRTSVFGAAGIYYQNNSPLLLSQNSEFKNLKDPRAFHYIAGLSHLLGDDTRLTLEGYYKKYDHSAMDRSLPQFFVLDVDNAELEVKSLEQLVDSGAAESYGVEITLQKKLAHGIYGLIGGSVFKTRYRDLDGIWRDRVFDNRYIFSIEGGYKPNKSWEFSARWIAAGGRPYTPLNLEESSAQNTTVLDDARVNRERYPLYHSLNIRADRRFHFKSSNLIIYLSLWNAYGQKNIATYYWNELEQRPDEITQWGLMPILGVEYEF